MRVIAAAIALTLPVPHVSFAEDGGAIEWSHDRKLAWTDFTGAAPAGSGDRRVAATAGSLAWSYKYSIARSRDTCRFTIEGITSQALFHPEQSWVRAGHETDAVLQHEQGHFDILQLYKENFDARTQSFIGTVRPCRGRSEQRATRDTQSEIDRLVGTIYEEVWNEYRNRQETYDRETRHGINAEAQSSWTKDIGKQLGAAERQ